MSAYMQYEASDGTVARWHGGEYIELGHTADRDGQFAALDVINVWDHAAGQPRIERTLEAFEEHVVERLAALAAEEAGDVA